MNQVMEPSANPPNENAEAPTPSCRRWLWISFGILALIVGSVALLFAKPSAAQYRFLSGAELIVSEERLMQSSPGRNLYLRDATYRFRESFFTVSSSTRKELLARGFRVTDEMPKLVGYESASRDIQLAVLADVKGPVIVVREIRDATFLDRARLWFR